MRSRVGDLPVGTRFVTLLTGRQGRVLAQSRDETAVVMEAPALSNAQALHPDVRVRVVEVTH